MTTSDYENSATAAMLNAAARESDVERVWSIGVAGRRHRMSDVDVIDATALLRRDPMFSDAFARWLWLLQ